MDGAIPLDHILSNGWTCLDEKKFAGRFVHNEEKSFKWPQNIRIFSSLLTTLPLSIIQPNSIFVFAKHNIVTREIKQWLTLFKNYVRSINVQE